MFIEHILVVGEQLKELDPVQDFNFFKISKNLWQHLKALELVVYEIIKLQDHKIFANNNFGSQNL